MTSPITTGTPAGGASSASKSTPANTAVSSIDNTSLDAVVDDLLDSLSSKFASVSSEIYEKIEAMSKRLDAMENSLQQQAGGK
ncbi:heat shock factor binding protein 1 [Tricharina praecox]|uniref:heat shock factor binding protein 1 n=1 Tax=Tricharina praecox TaxID=43433 RepID=UPI002220E6EA|nr:heat shock factor binding protein 1 [Tricharina praecox]KAI5843689.1 heat shock factor binding protein 1 [Tricharina praecox]